MTDKHGIIARYSTSEETWYAWHPDYTGSYTAKTERLAYQGYLKYFYGILAKPAPKPKEKQP